MGVSTRPQHDPPPTPPTPPKLTFLPPSTGRGIFIGCCHKEEALPIQTQIECPTTAIANPARAAEKYSHGAQVVDRGLNTRLEIGLGMGLEPSRGFSFSYFLAYSGSRLQLLQVSLLCFYIRG